MALLFTLLCELFERRTVAAVTIDERAYGMPMIILSSWCYHEWRSCSP